MRTLNRYIFFEILKIFAPLWLGLSFFPMILEWLTRVFKIQGSSFLSLLAFAYKYPSYLELVFPVAILLSTVIVFRSMNRNREIVAFESFGVRYRDMFWPLLWTLIVAGIPYLFISMQLSPIGLRAHYELYDKLRGQISHVGEYRREKIWYRNGDILYNVGLYDPQKKELLDVTLYEFDTNFQLSKITSAKKAVWNDNGWILQKGSELFVASDLEEAGRENFEVLENHVIDEPDNLKRYEFNPEILTQSELAATIERYEQIGISTSAWEMAYQQRLSFLAMSFVLILFAVPRTMRFRRTHNLAKDITLVSFFCLFLWILYSYCLSLGSAGRLPPVLAAWVPVGLLFIVACVNVLRISLRGQSE